MGKRCRAAELAFADTRHPRRGCRAVYFACGLILANVAVAGEGRSGGAASPGAEETGCEQVPASRRAQCLKVMSCLAVDDNDVRRACIEAAQRSNTRPAQPQQEAEPAQPVQPTPQRQDPSPPSRQSPPAREASARQQAPVIHEETIEPAQRQRRRSEVEEGAPKALPQEPPDEVSGTVSHIYQSILDRQLIAVDSKYLFESDRASHARLKKGERVTLAKISSRFWTGRKWRITGPSRTPIVAHRIRCEIQDIRSEDRRKCTQMLGR